MCVNAPEYLEAFFAAQKLGAVPVNVNYRYVGAELAYLLDNSDTAALVFHDEFAPTVADALADAARRAPAAPAAPGRARRRRRAARRRARLRSRDRRRARRARRPTREPSGDDLDLLLHRRHDRLPEGRDVAQRRPLRRRCGRWRGPGTQPPDVATSIARRQARRDAVCPRARSCTAPGCSSRCRRSSGGGTVVLLDTPRLDADAVWSAIEREHVQVCTIVGDAFARPLLAALDAAPAPLGPLERCARSRRRASRGARRPSAGCSRTCPHVTLIDSLGASEGHHDAHRDRATATTSRPRASRRATASSS